MQGMNRLRLPDFLRTGGGQSVKPITFGLSVISQLIQLFQGFGNKFVYSVRND